MPQKDYLKYRSKIEEIKTLYKSIPKGEKGKAREELAVLVKRQPSSLRNWWFCGAWEIPNDKVDEVLKFFKKPKE